MMTKPRGRSGAANHRYRHGHGTGYRHTPMYRAWSMMISRCTNPNVARYVDYGGRGIAVCERWRSFENFLADMGERPSGMTLDRIDNDGNYEPGNCHWTTRDEQARNTRSAKLTALATVLLRQMWLRARWYGSKRRLANAFGICAEFGRQVGNRHSGARALQLLDLELSRVTDLGISGGMQAGIEDARRVAERNNLIGGHPIEYRTLGEGWDA
jgi:hypothetical protein